MKTVYLLVFGDGSHIEFIDAAYKHQQRCLEAKAEIEYSSHWDGADQWIDCQRCRVTAASPHGWDLDEWGDENDDESDENDDDDDEGGSISEVYHGP